MFGMTKSNKLPSYLWAQPRSDYFIFHKNDSSNLPTAKLL